MTRIRNIFICFVVFGVSVWLVVPLAWQLSKLTDGIAYEDGGLNVIATGIMSSLGRSFAAMLAAAAVTVTTAGRKPERWAFIIAILYLVDAPVRRHWNLPATRWDRLWQSVDLLFPAIVCVAAAFITARFQRLRSGVAANEPES